MMDLQAGLASWSADFWPSLLAHLWQSTLFALVLMPVLLLLRRAPARLRYSIWLVASLKFILPSAALVALAGRFFAVPEVHLSAATFGFAGLLELVRSLLNGPVAAISTAVAGRHWLLVAMSTLWLAGTLGCAGLWFFRRRRFASHLHAAVLTTRGPAARLLEKTRQRLAIRRPVALALVPGTIEPGVWRIWRPLLVLPAQMPEHLSEEELEAIFLHELIHIRRWDNLVASLHMGLCCLFWFHPVVWLLDRRLLAAREEACDERVVELCGHPEPYVSGLLKAMRFGVGLRLAGVSSAHASNFRRRIERILSGERAAGSATLRRPLIQRACLAAGVLLLVTFSLGVGAGSLAKQAAPVPQEKGCNKKRAKQPTAKIALRRVARIEHRQEARLGPRQGEGQGRGQRKGQRKGQSAAAATSDCPDAKRNNPRAGSFNDSPRRAAR